MIGHVANELRYHKFREERMINIWFVGRARRLRLNRRRSRRRPQQLMQLRLVLCFLEVVTHFTVCPGISDPSYIVTYYIK